MLLPHDLPRLSGRLLPVAVFLILLPSHNAASGPEPGEPGATLLDRKVIAEVKAGSQILANLTHLCDEIGPRLTGSKNLQRANEWAAEKMRAYGLSNVHQEAWSLAEGWERGPAHARIVEPDNGVTLSIASAAWMPGTSGKVQGDVVVLKATTLKDLAAYKGKLKGAVVLARPPAKVPPLEEIDKPIARPGPAPDRPFPRPTEDGRAFARELAAFLEREGAAVLLTDSAKPLGLLTMTSFWDGKDRASAVNRIPRVFVAHNHYEMLYRLASRPAPARTRVEIEVRNTFVPGPLAVSNTVGEIRGIEKPDEVVLVGAHLDSWDLGQGATDNGSGTTVLLETARALAKSGVRPRRTIRFVLFTGEEQGLFGSKAYVEKHKDELPRISACLVHDCGVGKVTGIDARHRPVLGPLLARELTSLKDLGVATFDAPFIAGSDHAAFDRSGVPGLMLRQEMAGYRLSHHSQADTLDRAVEANLIQGAQVMAVTTLRLANLDTMLPRQKPERPPVPKTPPKEPARP